MHTGISHQEVELQLNIVYFPTNSDFQVLTHVHSVHYLDLLSRLDRPQAGVSTRFRIQIGRV